MRKSTFSVYDGFRILHQAALKLQALLPGLFLWVVCTIVQKTNTCGNSAYTFVTTGTDFVFL